jgi:hypothetical protein
VDKNRITLRRQRGGHLALVTALRLKKGSGNLRS